MEKIIIVLAALGLIAGSVPSVAAAAPCRDAKGKFIKCTPKAPKTVQCRDSKGKFVKCGTKGAKASK